MRPSRKMLPSLALFVAGILLGSQFQLMTSPLQQVNATQQPANPDSILPKEEPATAADHPVSELTDRDVVIKGADRYGKIGFPERAKQFLKDTSEPLQQALLQNMQVPGHTLISHMILTEIYDPFHTLRNETEKSTSHELEMAGLIDMRDATEFKRDKSTYLKTVDGVYLDEIDGILLNEALKPIDLLGNLIPEYVPTYNGLKYRLENEVPVVEPYLAKLMRSRWRESLRKINDSGWRNAPIADHPVSKLTDKDIVAIGDFGGFHLNLPDSAKPFMDDKSLPLRNALLQNMLDPQRAMISHMLLTQIYAPTNPFDKELPDYPEGYSIIGTLDLDYDESEETKDSEKYFETDDGDFVVRSKSGIYINYELHTLLNPNLKPIDLLGNPLHQDLVWVHNGLKIEDEKDYYVDPYLAKVFQSRWRQYLKDLEAKQETK